ncbi:hypothetical protein PHSC3_001123 [Chlamydiales bacterium STE3]|nr:hypothetical protein PHSC3_001123 [Chlamydiales bacterium STE3]
MSDMNVDNNSFLPFLTPPKPPEAESNLEGLSKTTQGAIRRDSQGNTLSDGGKSTQKSAASESDLEAALLEELAGAIPTKISGQAQVFTKDQISSVDSSVQFNDKFTLSKAFSSQDLSKLQSDSPDLPPAKDFNTGNVAKELAGNPWLNNSFMTALTANLMEVVRIKMSQQSMEGHITVQLFNVISDLGTALGDLAMAKAEKEAEMHMFQAMAAFMSFGITLAAGALSIGGLIASSVGSGMKGAAANKDAATAATSAGGRPMGGPASGTTTPSSMGNTGATNSATSTASTAAGRATPNAAAPSAPNPRAGIGGHRTPGVEAGSHRSSLGRTGSTLSGAPEGSQVSGVRTNQASAAQPGAPQSAAPARGQFGSRSQVSGESGAPQQSRTTSGGEIIKDNKVSSTVSGEGQAWSRGNVRQWKKGTVGKGDAGGGSVEGTPATPAEIRRAQNVITGGDIAASLGHTFTQASPQLGNIADNLIQMMFKPEIGEIERETQIRQMQKQIAQQAMESASKDFGEAGQALDQALQALQKIQDENSRAHTLGRG